MKHQLSAIFLAPLIISQALYVRRTTPKLPEPPGERFGIHGSGRLIRLMILGDSAAAGVGAPAQNQALSGQLVAALGSDFRVSWKLIAQTGHRAKDVLQSLEMLEPERFDVVVTSIGVNDITHQTGLKKWIEQHGRIIELLKGKFQCRHIILSGVPPMHLFPALPQPLRWYLGERARHFNNHLKKFTNDEKHCMYIEIDYPLEPEYMAADGFHPGAPAYSLWSRHLAVMIRDRLDQKEKKQ
ncbi:MAG: SGNH/GDSL hydrolase family protein [Smithellaceae bacterium]|nr:SGNH/GDSL hydrolase family protein [Smithellaceae bacterium]